MSRLIPEDIKHIRNSIHAYDIDFQKQIGMTLSEAACFALNVLSVPSPKKTAVIPVTSGLGVIDTFSESVCAILRHIGADAFVTEKTDVAGIQEAYLAGAEIMFLADDDVCAAFATNNNITSDNGYATGAAFAAALKSAMSEEDIVLVLGAGPVGKAAARWLAANNTLVEIYDPVYEKAEKAAANFRNITVLYEKPILSEYSSILDATPNGSWIQSNDISDNTIISAPGMPLSLSPGAIKKAKLIHNPLELGIITMYYDCASRMECNHGKNG